MRVQQMCAVVNANTRQQANLETATAAQAEAEERAAEATAALEKATAERDTAVEALEAAQVAPPAPATSHMEVQTDADAEVAAMQEECTQLAAALADAEVCGRSVPRMYLLAIACSHAREACAFLPAGACCHG